MEEYDFEMTRIKEENSQLRYQKELRERDYESVMFENNTLLYKLDNLENIFVGTPISKKDKGDMHLEPEIHLEEYSQSKVYILIIYIYIYSWHLKIMNYIRRLQN